MKCTEKSTAIAHEQAAFEQCLPELLKNRGGEFAIFKNGAPRGIFHTFDEAYAEALTRFGADEIFLISKIQKPVSHAVTSLSWECGVIGAPALAQ